VCLFCEMIIRVTLNGISPLDERLRSRRSVTKRSGNRTLYLAGHGPRYITTLSIGTIIFKSFLLPMWGTRPISVSERSKVWVYGHSLARFVWVRIPPGAWKSVCA
jgi:hypothetical protein